MVSIANFISSSIQHHVHFVIDGLISRNIDNKGGYANAMSIKIECVSMALCIFK